MDAVVVDGRKPCVQDTPPLVLVDQPMLVPPPLKIRPTWNVLTMVEPQANVSGSTSVACAPGGTVYGSELI